MLWALTVLPIASGILVSLTRKAWGFALAVAVGLLLVGLAAYGVAHPLAPVHYTYWKLDGIRFSLSLTSGRLLAWMALTTTVVHLMAQIYAHGYLDGDPLRERFAGFLEAFAGGMLLFVSAANLFTLYIGWEVMGLGSFLLIGHYQNWKEARFGATQAFALTRIGDAAFLAAVAWGMIHHVSTIAALNRSGPPIVIWLLVLAIFTKSAQGPFLSWLIGAMAGPTPASALIHAATMVAAGPFLLVRLFPLLDRSPALMTTLVVVGGLTAVWAGYQGAASKAVKELLANSTVSQLGLMLLALGVGSPRAAFALLVAHAAFKSLLFFLAGIATHRADSTLLEKVGGTLSQPLLAAFYAIGALAVAGLPPTAGFWAKDQVAAAATHAGLLAGVLAMLAALVGGAYAGRLTASLYRQPKAVAHLHPVDGWQTWAGLPLALVALGGVIGLPDPVHTGLVADAGLGTTAVDLTVVVLGAAAGYLAARPFPALVAMPWVPAWKGFWAVGEGMRMVEIGLHAAAAWPLRVFRHLARVGLFTARGRAQWYAALTSLFLTALVGWAFIR